MRRFVNLILLLFLVISAAPASQAAPVENTDLFTLRPGDVLQITVWKEEGMDQEILILPDGTLTFPLIGVVQAQGHTPGQLEKIIKNRLSNLIPDASVSVIVKAPLGHTVSVLGQVTKPGDVVMSGRMGVMQALSQAGGLTAFADEDDIKVLRNVDGVKKSIPFPYDDVANDGELEKDFNLQPGDVVFVPTAGLL